MAGVSKKKPKTLFAKRLKQLIGTRKNQHLETLCSLPNGSVNRYYDGQLPKLDVLIKICQSTKCPADWLLTGKSTDIEGLSYVILPILYDEKKIVNHIAYDYCRSLLAWSCTANRYTYNKHITHSFEIGHMYSCAIYKDAEPSEALIALSKRINSNINYSDTRNYKYKISACVSPYSKKGNELAKKLFENYMFSNIPELHIEFINRLQEQDRDDFIQGIKDNIDLSLI